MKLTDKIGYNKCTGEIRKGAVAGQESYNKAQ